MSMTRPEKMAASGDAGWRLAWRMARREIRGSVARFRVFLGALMLGVALLGLGVVLALNRQTRGLTDSDRTTAS